MENSLIRFDESIVGCIKWKIHPFSFRFYGLSTRMRSIYSVELNNFRYRISSFDEQPEKKPDSIMHDTFNCNTVLTLLIFTFSLSNIVELPDICSILFLEQMKCVSVMCWVRLGASKTKTLHDMNS